MRDDAPPCLVWLPADHRELGQPGQSVPCLVLQEKYARAVQRSAGAQPVVFPLPEADHIDALLAGVDGVMLTGSPANVHPRHFGQPVADPALPLDESRDALTLPLVRACLQQRIPLLGICRGFQEINVAMGGQLHQQVHTVPGHFDHRENKKLPLQEQYEPAHPVRMVADSLLGRIAGVAAARVNSLHGQGIATLAPGLRASAHADDGLIEAFEGTDADHPFLLAVQWHPEWRSTENPFYHAILQAFGDACRQRQRDRRRQVARLTSSNHREPS